MKINLNHHKIFDSNSPVLFCCILYDITLVVVLEFTPLFSEKYTYLWLSLWSQKRIITTALESHMHGGNTKPDTLLDFLFKKKKWKSEQQCLIHTQSVTLLLTYLHY